MAETQLLSMPVAVPPPETDPVAFYATFVGKLTASSSPDTGLSVQVSAEAEITGLYAPIKAAMRFVPAGTQVGETTVVADTLILQTWPPAYISLKDEMETPLPSEIHVENVDAQAVRNAVQPLFAAINRSDEAVESFMTGDGLLKVEAGTPVGAAAVDENAVSPETPDSVKILLFDATGTTINPLPFLVNVADLLQIDKTQHPLLSQLDLDGWVEVVVIDAVGAPISGEAYTLYLADGTTRTGVTDENGRIYETGISAGGWWIDIPGYPSFALLDE